MTKKQKRIEATLRAIYAGASGGVSDYGIVGANEASVSLDGACVFARFICGIRAYYEIKDEDCWPFRVEDLGEWDKSLADLAVWLDETFEWEGL